MVTTNPVPVTNEIVVSYPLEKVKQAISLLLECYSPKYFVPEKNGVSHALGTYVFTRPKGVNTPTIRMTVQEVGSDKTKIIFNSSSSSCNYSAIALHLNPRLKYTAKRPIKRQNKVSIFLAYVRYFLYLYTYERASYGHIKSTARHDSRDKVDA